MRELPSASNLALAQQQSSIRGFYPDFLIVWPLLADIQDTALRLQNEARLSQDLLQFSGRPRKLVLKVQPIRVPQDWHVLDFTKPDLKTLDVNLICANSADLILVYGESTEALDDLVASANDRRQSRGLDDLEVRIRSVRPAGLERLRLSRDNRNEVWERDSRRLVRWHDNPNPGLIMLEVDDRPKFSV